MAIDKFAFSPCIFLFEGNCKSFFFEKVFFCKDVTLLGEAPWSSGECRGLIYASHGPRTWVQIPASLKN